MKVSNVRSYSLGVSEKVGVKKDGTEYDLFIFHYLIEGELEARKIFVGKEERERRKMFRSIAEWGRCFRFSGEILGDGKVEIEEVLDISETDRDIGLF